MSRINYYVVTRPQGGWAVKKEGSSGASTITNAQIGFIQVGIDLAKQNLCERSIRDLNIRFNYGDLHCNDLRKVRA